MIVWQPNLGAQADAISARWCNELFYGGARGGGKSDFMLADFLQDVPTYNKYWHGIIFRKSYPELEELLKRANQLFPLTGATYKVQDKTWCWKNGATLKFRYAERVADLQNYQGHQYTWIGIDEATNFSFIEEMLGILRACLRGGEVSIPEKRIRLSGNPGGAGHASIKKLFIDPAPQGYKVNAIKVDDLVTTQMFIPAKLADNPALTKNDPTYVARLKMSGSPELVRMWLEGDWNVITGAFFPEFGIQHIKQAHELPKHWTKFMAMDWGSSRPFSVGWYAVSDGTDLNYPTGALIKYREWYGSTGKANEGLKLTAEEVAQGIKARELKDENISYRVVDPAMFKQDGGESLSERFGKLGLHLRPADNSRVAGWDRFRARLKGTDGTPDIYFFSNCTETIRTIPIQQHDEAKPEDIDTDLEDHALDETRYAIMSRPYTKTLPASEPMKDVRNMTLAEIKKQQQKKITTYGF